MSFQWIRRPPEVFPGGGFEMLLACRPAPEMKWKREDIHFTVLGTITSKVEDTERKFTFYRDESYPHRNLAWVKFEGHFGQGEWADCDFWFPEDPSFRKIRKYTEEPMLTDTLPAPRALPVSGSFGPSSSVSYELTVSIADEVSGAVTESTIPVKFFGTREDLDADPAAHRQTQAVAKEPHLNNVSSVKIRCPTLLAPGRPFSFAVAVSGSHLGSPTLQSFSLDLEEHTCIKQLETTEIRETSLHQVLHCKDLCLPISTTEDGPTFVEIGSGLGNFTPNEKLPPSVVMDEAERSYHLRGTLVLDFGLQTMEFLFDGGCVTVLAAKVASLAWAEVNDIVHVRDMDDGPPTAVKRERERLGIEH